MPVFGEFDLGRSADTGVGSRNPGDSIAHVITSQIDQRPLCSRVFTHYVLVGAVTTLVVPGSTVEPYPEVDRSWGFHACGVGTAQSCYCPADLARLRSFS